MSAEKLPNFKNFYEVHHPLVQDKLSQLRDKNTCHKEFKELVYELTLLLAYEATNNLPLKQKTIKTPLEEFSAPKLAGLNPVILPILRAGIGMVDALQSLMPAAKVGHIGLYRNEKTFEPEGYYFKVPKDSERRRFFVCDPMLATGGSAAAAVQKLKDEGVKEITFLCILAAPEGVKKFEASHPDVPIYSASMDRELDSNCYIRPGLGDAGDRLFGTH